MRKIIGILLVSLLTLPLGAQNKKPVQKKKQTTTVTKKPVQKRKGKSAKTTVNKSDYSTPSIKGLQNQRTQIQKEIHVQEKALKANQEDVKQRLQNLLLLNTSIDERQKSIEGTHIVFCRNRIKRRIKIGGLPRCMNAAVGSS